MRILYALLLLMAAFLASCGEGSPAGEREDESPTEAAAAAPSLTGKMGLWDTSDGPHLRGADLHPCAVDSAGACARLTSLQDVQDLRDLGANLINASYPGVFSEEPPYEVDPTALGYLDDLIGWAEETGMYVVIHVRTGPGRNEAAIVGREDPLYAVWTEEAAHKAWVEMWRFTAERYSDREAVAGYNLMVEPHVNTLIDPEGELSPEEVQAEAEGTLRDWNAFAAEITAAIRETDSATPIIVNSLNWGDPTWFPALRATGDPRTIYSLHAYSPDIYTHQDYEPGTDFEISYPSVVDDGGDRITFDRAWLEGSLGPALEFSQEHGVPVYVGEFGAMRWLPGAVEFDRGLTELFEQYGWNYAYYTWRANMTDWDGFDLEHGTDAEVHTPVPDNPLLAVQRDRWAQNVDFPSGASRASPGGGSARYASSTSTR